MKTYVQGKVNLVAADQTSLLCYVMLLTKKMKKKILIVIPRLDIGNRFCIKLIILDFDCPFIPATSHYYITLFT